MNTASSDAEADIPDPELRADERRVASAGSSSPRRSPGFLERAKDTLLGVYTLGVIGVTLVMVHPFGWLTAIGDGIVWPFTLFLVLRAW